MVFPGAHTDIAAWNDSKLLPAKFESVVQEEGEKRRKVAGVAPNNPITATLPTEGLDRLLISRYLRMAPDPAAEVLGTIEGGAPLLVRSQVGKGKVYVFAVSAQADFSNMPFTPVLLLTVHRMLMGHLGEVRDPPSLPTLTTLEFPVERGPGPYREARRQGRLALAPRRPARQGVLRPDRGSRHLPAGRRRRGRGPEGRGAGGRHERAARGIVDWRGSCRRM